MESDVVHKVTMLNLPEDVTPLSVERQPLAVNVPFQGTVQVEVVSSERQRENSECTMTLSDSHSFRPILPWRNGDGTTNHIVYKGLSRRALGIVMQNPGILEKDLIQQMDTLNPQNCRKMLGLMVLDNHLIKKKMYQTTSSGPPATLLSLFGRSKQLAPFQAQRLSVKLQKSMWHAKRGVSYLKFGSRRERISNYLDFNRQGRINTMLFRRLELLPEVGRLARSLQLPGHVG